jgi:hypothetical protein
LDSHTAFLFLAGKDNVETWRGKRGILRAGNEGNDNKALLVYDANPDFQVRRFSKAPDAIFRAARRPVRAEHWEIPQ